MSHSDSFPCANPKSILRVPVSFVTTNCYARVFSVLSVAPFETVLSWSTRPATYDHIDERLFLRRRNYFLLLLLLLLSILFHLCLLLCWLCAPWIRDQRTVWHCWQQSDSRQHWCSRWWGIILDSIASIYFFIYFFLFTLIYFNVSSCVPLVRQ